MIRCDACGQFIGYSDTRAKSEYTPDSHFTRERIEWVCGRCAEREAKDAPQPPASTVGG